MVAILIVAVSAWFHLDCPLTVLENDLRARGGVTVDLKWKDGSLQSATLTPDRDGPLVVRLAGKTQTVQGKAGTPAPLEL